MQCPWCWWDSMLVNSKLKIGCSYFRGSHGEVVRLRGVHMPPCSYTPIHLDAPYVQRVLIGYLFCYIIKCFPTLEAGMVGLSDLGGVHKPPMFICPLYVWMPPYVWTPPKCLDAPECLDAPCMFGWPLYVWMPPVCLDVPCMFGCPHMFGHPHTFWHPPYV